MTLQIEVNRNFTTKKRVFLSLN